MRPGNNPEFLPSDPVGEGKELTMVTDRCQLAMISLCPKIAKSQFSNIQRREGKMVPTACSTEKQHRFNGEGLHTNMGQTNLECSPSTFQIFHVFHNIIAGFRCTPHC